MKKLSVNWLTEGLMDFEYKKYLLLAYLQEVETQFGAQRLYPMLNDIIGHYKQLLEVRESKQGLEQHFSKTLEAIDWEKLALRYKNSPTHEAISLIADLIDYALPQFKLQLEQGRQLYENIEQQMELVPVGILPLYKDEGYLMLTLHNQRQVQLYLYKLSWFNHHDERFRSLMLQQLDERERQWQTYEQLKRQLIRQHPQLPNPATYLLVAHTPAPKEATLLPIAKRLLARSLLK